jgi:phosphoribosylaminoimidazole carboxylase / phosphoribosylaminoimidazole-succinocarboxamide synthase
MAEYVKGPKVGSGKTKILFEVIDHPDLVWVENKPDVTAHDDAAYTRRFDSKAVCATKTTAAIFELMNACGIPTAFVKKISDTEFIAQKCVMVPLEVVARRLAVGSFVQRRPDLKAPEGVKPNRFPAIYREFFLKTTKGKLEIGGESYDLGLPQIPAKDGGTKPLDDPLIRNVWGKECELWDLMMPKQPVWEKGADLGIQVSPNMVLSLPYGHCELRNPNEIIKRMDQINHKAFLLIEGAWAILGYVLVDWKIEFGWTRDGKLVIADVVDNDSWRLKGRDFQELSKQLHRDGLPLSEVEAKYGLVTEMVQQMRLPKQALVIWKGSPDDKSPEVPKIPGVQKIEIALSGHKKTKACLARLEELLRDYPDGGVILAVVGMSNGLGPVLSSHTSWPVIGVPLTAKECPDDVWSSLRLPSQNPMATILSDKNAVLFALTILALKNPAAYMERQFALEQLDTGY